GDVDGDGSDGLVIVDRTGSLWSALDAETRAPIFEDVQWGRPDDIPFLAYLDGDESAEIAVYRLLGGVWFARDPIRGERVISQVNRGGVEGDIPLLHDVTGDGLAEPVIYRPGEAFWYAKGPRTGAAIFRRLEWGLPR
ncbi:MAG: hypothetical protein AAF074_26810, partial [Pseudomonadota bacterium]